MISRNSYVPLFGAQNEGALWNEFRISDLDLAGVSLHALWVTFESLKLKNAQTTLYIHLI